MENAVTACSPNTITYSQVSISEISGSVPWSTPLDADFGDPRYQWGDSDCEILVYAQRDASFSQEDADALAKHTAGEMVRTMPYGITQGSILFEFELNSRNKAEVKDAGPMYSMATWEDRHVIVIAGTQLDSVSPLAMS